MKRLLKLIASSLICLVIFTGCEPKNNLDITKETPRPEPRTINYSHSTNDFDTGAFYNQTEWSGAHRDSRNSDYIPIPSTGDVEFSWHALNKSNFFMGAYLNKNGDLYVTTGDGPGKSHLHAFDRAGNVLWQTEPMETMDDFDYGAYFSATVTDIDGNLYVPDTNQFWSFTPDGEVRWVRDTEEIMGEQAYAFSAFFTKEGYVGSTWDNGTVMLFDRATGDLVTQLDLPGVDGVPATDLPPGIMESVLYEPFIQESWDAVWGFNIEVANTTAVDPVTGRLYVVATGRKADETVLYGIDTTEDSLSIMFETIVGSTGSGTSPTLSFNGEYVYVTDGSGHLTGVNTQTGEIQWHSKNTTIAGVSSSTSPNGNVYSFNFNKLIAWDGSNGDVIWERDMTEAIAKDAVKGLPGLYGKPGADVVSGIAITSNLLWFVVGVHSAIPIPEKLAADAKPPVEGLPTDVFRQYLSYYLVSYDHEGNFVSKTPFADAGALAAISVDGRIYATSLSASTTIAYYGANPKLPFFMRNTPEPLGGLTAYEPVSFLVHLKSMLSWSQDVLKLYRENGNNNGEAYSVRYLEQMANVLNATSLVIDEAHFKGELTDDEADALKVKAEALNVALEIASTTEVAEGASNIEQGIADLEASLK